MTTFCHVSDTHGYLFPLMPADIVIHTGDLLPNRTRGIRPVEKVFQYNWLNDHMEKFKAWLGERPFMFLPGNHDYIDPVPQLRAAGIDARDMKGHTFQEGLHFYGFHWVPWFTGEWNNEMPDREIYDRFNCADADVVLAHAPIYGVRDRNAQGERCGSRSIRVYMQNANNAVPAWYMHGHIHEAAGLQGWSRGIKVSNAATTCRVIEI